MEKIPLVSSITGGRGRAVTESMMCQGRRQYRGNITHKPDSVVLLGYNERYDAWFLHAMSLVKAWARLRRCRRNLILL